MFKTSTLRETSPHCTMVGVVVRGSLIMGALCWLDVSHDSTHHIPNTTDHCSVITDKICLKKQSLINFTFYPYALSIDSGPTIAYLKREPWETQDKVFDIASRILHNSHSRHSINGIVHQGYDARLIIAPLSHHTLQDNMHVYHQLPRYR